MIDHKCDACGAQATHAVRDVRDVTEHGDMWRRFEPRGELRYGCDRHKVHAFMYNRDDKVLGRLADDDMRPIS
ncbi:MAG TPA: hypothetical protein VM531_11245 [Sphingomicrobium sp.]|jgi:hypothetical protein|nr:hypothetical protein [Sphingomicrobium sp.]